MHPRRAQTFGGTLIFERPRITLSDSENPEEKPDLPRMNSGPLRGRSSPPVLKRAQSGPTPGPLRTPSGPLRGSSRDSSLGPPSIDPIEEALGHFDPDLRTPVFLDREDHRAKFAVYEGRIDKCDKLLDDLRKEQRECKERLNSVTSEIQRLLSNEEQATLTQFEGELEAIVLDQTKLEDSRKEVSCIKQGEFAALKNLKRPPAVLEHVLIGIGTLFGIPQKWKDVQRFMLLLETKGKILEFNPTMCASRDVQKAKEWIQSHAASFKEDRIKRASRSMAPLGIWLNHSVAVSKKYKKGADLDELRHELEKKIDDLKTIIAGNAERLAANKKEKIEIKKAIKERQATIDKLNFQRKRYSHGRNSVRELIDAEDIELLSKQTPRDPTPRRKSFRRKRSLRYSSKQLKFKKSELGEPMEEFSVMIPESKRKEFLRYCSRLGEELRLFDASGDEIPRSVFKNLSRRGSRDLAKLFDDDEDGLGVSTTMSGHIVPKNTQRRRSSKSRQSVECSTAADFEPPRRRSSKQNLVASKNRSGRVTPKPQRTKSNNA